MYSCVRLGCTLVGLKCTFFTIFGATTPVFSIRGMIDEVATFWVKEGVEVKC